MEQNLKIRNENIRSDGLGRKHQRHIYIILMSLIVAGLFWQCDKITPGAGANLTEQTCEGCHTNIGALRSLVPNSTGDSTVDIPAGAVGVTRLSRANRVYIRLSNGHYSFAEIDTIHGRISCTGCHSGVSPVNEESPAQAMQAAHVNLQHDPSTEPGVSCGGSLCHGDRARRFETSMHANLWGEKAQLAQRYGGEGFSFDQSPAKLQTGYAANCSSCHVTCGQCHVSRPTVVGGGFAGDARGGNHKFIRKPSETYNCTACHSSTIGTDWNGVLPGNQPDVHNQFGLTCRDCHNEDFHGNGVADADITSRYATPDLPSCYTPCHANDADDNLYHRLHWANQGPARALSCFVCHAQSYNNFDESYAGDHSRAYEDLKIGLNPDYQHPGKPNNQEKWITVRHVPVSRNAFADWGIPTLPHFDDVETYRYTSPHNIQRWTARTLVNADWATPGGDTYNPTNCYQNCHLHQLSPQGAFTGPLKDSYLLSGYLDEHGQNDEKMANEPVTVDEQGEMWRGCGNCHDS